MGKPANGSRKSSRARFDKMEIPGKFKESPRGTERKFRNVMCACYLRTQQRAKSQCMINVQTPVGAGSSESGPCGFSHVSLMVGFWFPGSCGSGAGHSTESLILAQDERWRRA